MFDFDDPKPISDLLGRFSQLAVFNILSNLTEPLAGLISIAFLGHLSDIHDLAGVSLATVLFNYIYDILFFLRVSTTAITAQSVGRDDTEGVLLVCLRNAFIALVIGALIFLLHYPLGKFGFAFLRGSPEVESLGLSYFNARILGAPAVLLNYVILGWFLGREESGKLLLLTGIGNITNVVLNYVAIIQWNLGSRGAGLSQATSEYLMLLIGILLVGFSIDWKILPKVMTKLWNWQAFKSTFIFNRDLSFQLLAYTFMGSIFFNLSAGLGTEALAINTLLLQIAYLIMFLIEGVGLATETLTGTLQGQLANDQFLPLLQISLVTSLGLGVVGAGTCILLPETVFGSLTNHTEIIEPLKQYVPWILLVLSCFSIAWILEAYFAGLAKGHSLRNAALVAVVLGFSPVAIWAWFAHNNHILWLALSMFMVSRVVALAVQLPGTFETDSKADT
ncbi:MAG: guanitoxin biosynthesis MATE family efflux transporter GntT [Nostoc sp.]